VLDDKFARLQPGVGSNDALYAPIELLAALVEKMLCGFQWFRVLWQLGRDEARRSVLHRSMDRRLSFGSQRLERQRLFRACFLAKRCCRGGGLDTVARQWDTMGREMVRGSDTAIRLTYSMKEGAPKRVRQAAEHEIGSALLRHAGDVSKAAGYLGVGRSTLNRWIAGNAFLQRQLAKARREGTQ
jgi:hypothetical protein